MSLRCTACAHPLVIETVVQTTATRWRASGVEQAGVFELIGDDVSAHRLPSHLLAAAWDYSRESVKRET